MFQSEQGQGKREKGTRKGKVAALKKEPGKKQLNSKELKQRLSAAVDALVPNVLPQVDLSTPQNRTSTGGRMAAMRRLERRLRVASACAAVFLFVVLTGALAGYYQIENRRVESVIGIDVNPSVELSANKKDRVLEARALNQDAQNILAGMDLRGVDLNVAVNAVVGAMVTEGYLDDLDNAILVTVNNDSVRKASALRASVVGDIEQALKENQVEAVVYDQQVIEDEEMASLAKEYGISYGKAFFLKELVDENPELDMEDMAELSAMTMEEIAARITESSYVLGEYADQVVEREHRPQNQPQDNTLPVVLESSMAAEESVAAAPAPSETADQPLAATLAQAQETAQETPQTLQTEPERVQPGLVDIDYVDYEDGTIFIYFVTRVKWKNPTVSVRDEEGNSYPAYVEDTSGSECSVRVTGVDGGQEYTFVLGGLVPAEGGSATTVTGYFEAPEIASELATPSGAKGDPGEDD